MHCYVPLSEGLHGNQLGNSPGKEWRKQNLLPCFRPSRRALFTPLELTHVLFLGCAMVTSSPNISVSHGKKTSSFLTSRFSMMTHSSALRCFTQGSRLQKQLLPIAFLAEKQQ